MNMAAVDDLIATAANGALGRSRRLAALERLDAQLARADDARAAFDHLLVSLAGLLLPDCDRELGQRAAASLGLLGVVQPDRFIESMFHRLHQVQELWPQTLLLRAVQHLLDENAGRMSAQVQAQAAAHVMLHGLRLLHEGSALLPALCGLVGCIARHHPRALLAQLPALVDLLLGWSLQPLAITSLHAICTVFADMSVLWRTNSAYAVDLLFSLCHDVHEEAASARAARSSATTAAEDARVVTALSFQLALMQCATAIAHALPEPLLERCEHEHRGGEPAAPTLGSSMIAALLQLRVAGVPCDASFMDCVVTLASLPCEIDSRLHEQLARLLLWEGVTGQFRSFGAICTALDAHTAVFGRTRSPLLQLQAQNLLQGLWSSARPPPRWCWSPLRRLRLCSDASVVSRVLELYVLLTMAGRTARTVLVTEVGALMELLHSHASSLGCAHSTPLVSAMAMGLAALSRSEVETLLAFNLSVLRVAAQRSQDSAMCAELCFELVSTVGLFSRWSDCAPPTVSLAILLAVHSLRSQLLPSGSAAAVTSEWAAVQTAVKEDPGRGGDTSMATLRCFSRAAAQRVAASQLWDVVLAIWKGGDGTCPAVLRVRAAELAQEELWRDRLPLPAVTSRLLAAAATVVHGDGSAILRVAAARILCAVACHPGIVGDSAGARFLFENVLLCLSDPHSDVRTICMEALVALAATGARRWDRCPPETFASRRNRTLACVSLIPAPKSVMLPSLFRHLVEYISGDTVQSLRWIRDCYLVTTQSSCTDADRPDNGALLAWCTATCARFCITSKLRTHFGNPAATFTGLERIAKAAGAPFGGYEMGARSLDVVPLHVLLLFVERLETEMRSAARSGSAPGGSSPSSQFFKANQRVVGDWLHRMRPHLLRASTQCGAIGPTIRNAFLRLRDVRRSASSSSTVTSVPQLRHDLDACLRPLCNALCFLRDSDAIKGLCSFSVAFLTHANQQGSREENKVPWLFGLYLQSQGRFEEASQEYRAAMRVLTAALDEAVPGPAAGAENRVQPKTLFGTTLTAGGVEHLVNASVDCYVALGDWTALQGWVSELEHAQSKVRGLKDRRLGTLLSALEPQFGSVWLKSRVLLETDGLEAACGSAAHLVPNCEMPEVTDIHSCMRLSDRLRLQSILYPEGSEQLLSDARSLLGGPLAVAASDAPNPGWVEPLLCSLHLVDAETGVKDALSLLDTPMSSTDDVMGDGDLPHSSHGIDTLGELLRIRDRLADELDSDAAAQSTVAVQRLAGMARKHSNTRLADRLLQRSDCTSGGPRRQWWRLFEESKLLDSKGQPVDAVVHMWQLLATITPGGQPDLVDHAFADAGITLGPEHASPDSEWQAKLLLQLSRNLRGRRERLASADAIAALKNAGVLEGSCQTSSAGVRLDDISGRCLATATRVAPTSASSWAAYSSWCYQRGMRDVNLAQGEEKVDRSEREALSELVSTACHDSTTAEARSEAVDLLVREVVGFREVETEPDKARSKFQCACGSCSEDALAVLLDIRERVKARVLAFVRLSVTGYFRNLRLSEEGRRGNSGDSTTLGGEAMQVNSTLRLLRMLVKFGHYLQQEFDRGMSTTPIAPWRQIVPQLLARLGHPRPFVAQQVEALLLRLAQAEPSLLVYHAVAGVPSEAATAHNDGDGVVACRVQRIKGALQQAQPQLVAEVERLMHEMTRMTGLWDERLSIMVHSLANDVSRRLNALAEEVTRAASNLTLTEDEQIAIARQNFVAVMCHPYSVLQTWWDTVRETQGLPETPHESQFHSMYFELVEQLLHVLRCPADPRKPQEVGNRFKDLTQALQSVHTRTTLVLPQVSPALAQRGPWLVTIPGVSWSSDQDPVTIHTIVPEIEVLRTKTRPKKLVFVGSDGIQYGYLLKGNEDLHLDERIMQLLRVVNDLLSRENYSVPRCLRARNYAVIPMSGHSGLIQWVADATPLFRLVTEVSVPADPVPPAASGEKVECTAPSAPKRRVLPPSAQFQAKMLPALKQRGIATDSSRKDWPQDVLKSVFRELRDGSPSGLLEKEIWQGSTGAADWWARTAAYARSVAVMSVVGFVIGLGDRHLDNILFDIRTGEVVHIDYNVCFDRGLKLKVPEVVPFRLTKMLTEALGIAGVEGHFRIASEQAMWVMRRHRETLVTLLEAFVYDPLVDWEAEHVDHEERKMMETNANLAVMSGRVCMLKGGVQQACTAVSESFGALQDALRTAADLSMQYASASQVQLAAEQEAGVTAQDQLTDARSLKLIGFGLEDAQTEHARLSGALVAFNQECQVQMGRFAAFAEHLKSGGPFHSSATLGELAARRCPLQRCAVTVVAVHSSASSGGNVPPSLPPLSEVRELARVSEQLDNAALDVLRDGTAAVSAACLSLQRYREHLEGLQLLDGYERHTVQAAWTTWISALLREGEVSGGKGTHAAAEVGAAVHSELGSGQLCRAESCIATMVRLQGAGQTAQQLSMSIGSVASACEATTSAFGTLLDDMMLVAGAEPRAAWHAVAALDGKITEALQPAGAGPAAARQLWCELCQGPSSGDQHALSSLVTMASGVVEHFIGPCCALRAACVAAAPQHSATGSADMFECRIELARSILRMLQNNAKPQGLHRRLHMQLENALSTFLGTEMQAALRCLCDKLTIPGDTETLDAAGRAVTFDTTVRQLYQAIPLCTADTSSPLAVLTGVAGVLDGLCSDISRDTACLQWLNDGQLRRFAMHNGRTPFTAPRDEVMAPLEATREPLQQLLARVTQLQTGTCQVADRLVHAMRHTSSHAGSSESMSTLHELNAAQSERSGWWSGLLRVLQQCSDDINGALTVEGSLVAMRGHNPLADGVDSRGAGMVTSFERTMRAIIETASVQLSDAAGLAEGADRGPSASSTNSPLSKLEQATQEKTAAEVAIAMHFPNVLAAAQDALDAVDEWDAKRGVSKRTLKAEVGSAIDNIAKLAPTKRMEVTSRAQQFRKELDSFQHESSALHDAESAIIAIVAPRVTAYQAAKATAESTTEQVMLAVDATRGLLSDLLAAHGDFSSKLGQICDQSNNMTQKLAKIADAALSLAADEELGEVPAVPGCSGKEDATPPSEDSVAAGLAEGRNLDQERSTYALNLVRRVKGKLEGRTDCIATCRSVSLAMEGALSRSAQPATKLNVQEQVDLLIQQATSEDNLCRMFEGWTPWV